MDVDVELVKNDMVYCTVIESGVEMRAKERYQHWYDAAMAELDAVEYRPWISEIPALPSRSVLGAE